MSVWEQLRSFFADGSRWQLASDDGIPQRLVDHVGYSALALLIAAVIAVPVGCLIGHTGRGAFVAINVGNAGRALPTLGVLILAVLVVGIGLGPVLVALVLLAVPSLLTTTYAGIRAVDRSVVDAARGMGMSELMVLVRVELPNALPIMISGLRNGALQVIATATVAAYVGLGGLGRFLFDGLGSYDYGQMLGGAILVAALAVTVDALLLGVERLTVSPGVSGRLGRRSTAPSLSVSPASAAGAPVER
jgi:osmoprotectant transport system permease protein